MHDIILYFMLTKQLCRIYHVSATKVLLYDETNCRYEVLFSLFRQPDSKWLEVEYLGLLVQRGLVFLPFEVCAKVLLQVLPLEYLVDDVADEYPYP